MYIFYVKLQRNSIAFYQTLNDRNLLISFDTVKVVQKRLSTPSEEIFYVLWTPISFGNRIGVNLTLLCKTVQK